MIFFQHEIAIVGPRFKVAAVQDNLKIASWTRKTPDFIECFWPFGNEVFISL
jgi:hypothetical protein